MYYDRIEGNIIFPLISNPPFVNSASYDNGNLANIAGGSASALTVFGTLAAIDPELKTPMSMNFSLGVQHELPLGIFLEINAVGNLGRFLTRNPDINTVPFERLIANAALPAAQQFVENAMRPYLGYSAINQRKSDSTSNYTGAQFYLAKRSGDILGTMSYTYSKVFTDASNFNDNLEDPFNRAFNYGPATFRPPACFCRDVFLRAELVQGQEGLSRVPAGWLRDQRHHALSIRPVFYDNR